MSKNTDNRKLARDNYNDSCVSLNEILDDLEAFKSGREQIGDLELMIIELQASIIVINHDINRSLNEYFNLNKGGYPAVFIIARIGHHIYEGTEWIKKIGHKSLIDIAKKIGVEDRIMTSLKVNKSEFKYSNIIHEAIRNKYCCHYDRGMINVLIEYANDNSDWLTDSAAFIEFLNGYIRSFNILRECLGEK